MTQSGATCLSVSFNVGMLIAQRKSRTSSALSLISASTFVQVNSSSCFFMSFRVTWSTDGCCPELRSLRIHNLLHWSSISFIRVYFTKLLKLGNVNITRQISSGIRVHKAKNRPCTSHSVNID